LLPFVAFMVKVYGLKHKKFALSKEMLEENIQNQIKLNCSYYILLTGLLSIWGLTYFG